jgi:predicted Fe-Mo cluster-binding NifX family protein
MDKILVAIPSDAPGGLEAGVGQHFGHCDVYTVVEIDNGKVGAVSTLPNVPHQQGGCLAPVNHLAANGINALIAGGMGMRPLMGFVDVGIKVFSGVGAPSVGAAVDAFAKGGLQQFDNTMTCGGGK